MPLQLAGKSEDTAQTRFLKKIVIVKKSSRPNFLSTWSFLVRFKASIFNENRALKRRIIHMMLTG